MSVATALGGEPFDPEPAAFYNRTHLMVGTSLVRATVGRWRAFVRRFPMGVDLALLAFLSVPAWRPLLAPGYLDTHDGLFHLFRLVELDAAIRAGDLYPRLAPNLALGYDYPVFNYYAPLSLYVAELFRLAGLGFTDAVKATLGLSVAAAGWTMYLFARDLLPRTGALLAALAYGYLPYLLVDVYVRGSLAEAVALALLPLLLRAVHRLAGQPDAGRVATAGLALAALILAHNVTALLFMPVLIAFWLLAVTDGRRAHSPQAGGPGAEAPTTSLSGASSTSPAEPPGTRDRGPGTTNRLTGASSTSLTDPDDLPPVMLSRSEASPPLEPAAPGRCFAAAQHDTAGASQAGTDLPGVLVAAQHDTAGASQAGAGFSCALPSRAQPQRGGPGAEPQVAAEGASRFVVGASAPGSWLAGRRFVVGASAPGSRLVRRVATAWQPALATQAALLLGLALSAFYWAPALFERDLVASDRLTTQFFDYHEHFQPASQLIQPSLAYDYRYDFEQRVLFRAGLVQVILAGLGFIAALNASARIHHPITPSSRSAGIPPVPTPASDPSEPPGSAGVSPTFVPAAGPDRRSGSAGVSSVAPQPTGRRDACAPGGSLLAAAPSREPPYNRREWVFWGWVLAGGIVLQWTRSAPIWEAIPLLAYAQFPWRLLAPVGLAASLLTGAIVRLPVRGLGFLVRCPWSLVRGPWSVVPGLWSVVGGWWSVVRGPRSLVSDVRVRPWPRTRDRGPGTVDRGPRIRDPKPGTPNQKPETRNQKPETTDHRPGTRDLVVVLLGAVIIASAVADLRPRHIALAEGDVRPWTIQRIELDRKLVAATAGEYLPRDARLFDVPHPPPGLPAAGALRLTVRAAGPFALEADVAADRPATVILDRFFFPGWQAHVDGRPVVVKASGPRGLLAVEVPAGEHHLSLWFGTTALRSAAGVVSGAALLTLVGVSMRRLRGQLRGSNQKPETRNQKPATSNPAWPSAVGLVGLGLLATTLRAPAVDPGLPIAADFGSDVRLAGAGFDGIQGDRLAVTLFWQARNRPNADYAVALRLLDGAGRTVGERTKRPLFGLRPTDQWQAGQLIRDHQEVALDPGVPAGEYELVVGVADRSSGAFLRPAGPAVGWGEGAGVSLGRFRLPERANPQALVLTTADVRFGDQIALMGYQVSRLGPGGVEQSAGSGAGGIAAVGQGERLRVRLRWLALRDLDEDYAVFAHLLDSRQTLLVQDDEWPHRGFRPTSLWLPGEEVDDEYVISVPLDAPPGRYDLSIGFYRRGDYRPLPVTAGRPASDRLSLGAVKIVPRPPLALDRLPLRRRLAADLGGEVLLAGYDLRAGAGDRAQSGPLTIRPGARPVLTLYWEARQRPNRDYTVFVHFVDSAGRVQAQADGQPGGGGYPTTLWEPGEVVADRRVLDLPPGLPAGRYRLLVGMYLLETGARLQLPTGEDSVLLEEIDVG
ncbi:MAG: hypothetical protein HY331_06035 [Chloroflexi bacterium]|nr:hypothetical protein [Chloroflexota bacterium]